MKLATLLRISLAVQWTAGTALLAWWLPAQLRWPWAPLLALLLPVIGTAIVLAIELLVAAIIDPRRPRSSPLQVLRVWAGETLCSVRAFGWSMPFRAGFAEPPIVRDPARPAVLLIAGYVCNRAVWRPLLASGELADCNVATVNIQPVFGSIDLYAAEVHGAVQRLRTMSGAEQVILVGHSMGGLAIRAYLRQYGDHAVRRVVTLATPHHGTVFGILGHGANARQMARGCAYLTTLAGAETVSRRRRFVCIATADDNLVVPRSSPLLPDAQHQVIDGVGHLALVEDPRAWRLLADAIRRPGPAA